MKKIYLVSVILSSVLLASPVLYEQRFCTRRIQMFPAMYKPRKNGMKRQTFYFEKEKFAEKHSA